MGLLDPIQGFLTIPADSTVDVTPPAGDVWDLQAVNVHGDGTNEGWALFLEGADFSSVGVLHPATGIGEGGVDYGYIGYMRVPMDDGNSLRIMNHSTLTRGSHYSGWRMVPEGNIGLVRSLVRRIPANSVAYVTPAAGEQWLITGCSASGDGADAGAVYVRWDTVVGPVLLDREEDIGEGNLWGSANHRVRTKVSSIVEVALSNGAEAERGLYLLAVRVNP